MHLPVLLLPPAAAAEMQRVRARMADALGGSPAEAYTLHFSPLAWDLGAALAAPDLLAPGSALQALAGFLVDQACSCTLQVLADAAAVAAQAAAAAAATGVGEGAATAAAAAGEEAAAVAAAAGPPGPAPPARRLGVPGVALQQCGAVQAGRGAAQRLG
jgi:hypothetical protein